MDAERFLSDLPKPPATDTTAHFAKQYPDGDEIMAVSATHEAFGWAAGEIERRRQSAQPLVLLMDGQHSLWDAAALHDFPGALVEILDIVHVSSYVLNASASSANNSPYIPIAISSLTTAHSN